MKVVRAPQKPLPALTSGEDARVAAIPAMSIARRWCGIGNRLLVNAC
ncbi:hypothetical protein [Actinoallomurus acanthiterrae]